MKITITKNNVFYAIVAPLLTSQLWLSTSAMNLVVSTDEANRSVLQDTLSVYTNGAWEVQAYEGSNLALVDDIRQRAVSAQLPAAAQIPGATIQRWAGLGFIQTLSENARVDQWQSRLPSAILANVSYRNEFFAIPTQIERGNWMWLNRDVLASAQDGSTEAPKSWQSFLELAEKTARQGKPFLVVVDDPAQNTLIFESMLLGLKGPEFYQKTFEALEFSALRSSEMVDVFEIFNQLRPMLNGFKYANWEEAGSALSAGSGAVMFSGSWSGPTFSDSNGQIAEHIMCEPLPEASATFLYNLNSVVLFKDTQLAHAATLANSIFGEHMLTDLNVNQGSIPARLDISPWGFDRCSVRAMREFRSAHTINTLKPSLAVGMATNEMVQKNVYEAINEFVSTPSMTPEEGANNLAKSIRVAVYRM